MPAEPVLFLALAAAGLVLAVALSPARAQQRRLIARGTAGLAGVAAIAFLPTLDGALAGVLALGLLQSAIRTGRPFAVRLRPIVTAVAAIALALLFARVTGPEVLQRFAAVGIVAGLAAAVGVLPYMHEFDPEEAVTASPVVWIAFVGPALAFAILVRAETELGVAAGGLLGGMLIGIGLINMVWGAVAAWLTENAAAAWRYSFLADWGLALCGLGLTVADGRRGAVLVLFSVILGRLPLYLVSRDAVREPASTERPINLVVAAVLAGSAPFAGFAGRVLLLRGATDLYWPLALVLVIAMLLWLPGSLRLGRSLGLPRGRQVVGVAIVIAINAAAGLYPLPILKAAGL